MGLHVVDLVFFSFKLNKITRLGIAAGAEFFFFVWPLHDILFRVNCKYFTLL